MIDLPAEKVLHPDFASAERCLLWLLDFARPTRLLVAPRLFPPGCSSRFELAQDPPSPHPNPAPIIILRILILSIAPVPAPLALPLTGARLALGILLQHRRRTVPACRLVRGELLSISIRGCAAATAAAARPPCGWTLRHTRIFDGLGRRVGAQPTGSGAAE